ncbi:MAG: lytic transglycosylase domain-containing protein [Proteobacteria bacterium]|nr:lytic transglycosylase domain-containing protein [Pseudomonadota bacterium]MBU4129836.1 lytic transglycosylase domain-containing protein [Pseudomonadota bacterium]
MSQLLTAPGNKVELLHDPKGCKKITITDLNFSQENSLLKFEIKVHIKAGIELMNTCLFPIDWEGYVVFFQTPEIAPENWILSLKTKDSLVLNKNREPGIMAGAVWKLIKGNVHAYVDAIQIDLTPSVNEIKSFLSDMFPERLRPQAVLMVESMAPGKIEIQNNAVQIGINTDISSVHVDDSQEETLNDKELERFIETWEAMDAFIVYLVNSMTDRPLSEDEKDRVLETLLNTRYRFIKELNMPAHENDFVRHQFIIAWDNLSVLFKNHIGNNFAASPLGSLAFFSSMDALKVLDSIGPTMGIEVSRNGLIRLARLMNNKKTPDLFYSLENDEALRTILGLEPKLKESLEPIPEEPQNDTQDFLNTLFNRLPGLVKDTIKFIRPYSEAIAAEPLKKDILHLEKWLPDRMDNSEYVKKIRSVLEQASGKTIAKNKRDRDYHDHFRLIVDAVAWQESCFRQFKRSNEKIVYLRSYNNTSVGLMQVNERVWRGLYDQEKLRWNIGYNIEAGCEILDLYLNRYILRKMEQKKYKGLENKDTIARTLYALYNGGPGEFSRFLERNSKEKFYISDVLFYEKYLWVKNSQWENAGICLGDKKMAPIPH